MDQVVQIKPEPHCVGGMEVKLYSCYPAGCTVAEAARVRKRIVVEERMCLRSRLDRGVSFPRTGLTDRGLFPALPWLMSELPGTVWRNVHTFGKAVIEEIRENRVGLPGPDPDRCINAMFRIGLWWSDRFVIEHWVRVDLLSVSERMEWYCAEVEYCIGRYYEALRAVEAWGREKSRASTYGVNLGIRERTAERAGDEKDRAIRAARSFASEHGLVFDVDVVNRLAAQTTQTVQLALF